MRLIFLYLCSLSPLILCILYHYISYLSNYLSYFLSHLSHSSYIIIKVHSSHSLFLIISLLSLHSFDILYSPSNNYIPYHWITGSIFALITSPISPTISFYENEFYDTIDPHYLHKQMENVYKITIYKYLLPYFQKDKPEWESLSFEFIN